MWYSKLLLSPLLFLNHIVKIKINVWFSDVVFVSHIKSTRENFKSGTRLLTPLQSLIRKKILCGKVQGEGINLPTSFYAILPKIFHTFLVLMSLNLICWEIYKNVERKQVSNCPMTSISGEKVVSFWRNWKEHTTTHYQGLQRSLFQKDFISVFLWAPYQLMLMHFSR